MRTNMKSTTTIKILPADPLQKLLTVSEVAAILGLSKVKVYALLKSGLPSIKIDGARRVQPGKLQAWIEQHGE
ncbi:MAG TPA: helix-turn-helix domain-containing protein [Ktedonobacteraceae bacterium]|nr:helix-turn-helix domain-containing protein [Ktedonobacteraceae bacterium]HZU66237.1 helix-turn-helix domain-containing protein [Ktedonobacteraceae bacterium]